MNDNTTWYNLDNQANIYPAVSDPRNTNVFRLACTLSDYIRPQTLSEALEQTMLSFPYYRMTLRRGLFWFYLEPTKVEPTITRESQRPCQELFHVQSKNLLFSVTYFGKRINLEVFHALADGGGAMEFLRDLVSNYLLLSHGHKMDNHPILEKKASPATQVEDGFKKNYTLGDKNTTFSKNEKAFLLEGTTLPFNDIHIICATISTKAILSLSKASGASMTAYITAVMICAIEQEMMPKRYLNKDISINVPVDLRGLFPSQTFRNYFSVISIRYNFGSSPNDFDTVLASVTTQLKEKTTKEFLMQTLNYNMSVQRNMFARAVPLILKNIVLKTAYRMKEATDTSTISNLGRVLMPKEFSDYIEDFQCLVNPSPIHKVKLGIISYEDKLTINFTSNIEETSIQRYFIRHLTSNGVDVCVTVNGGSDIETV